MLRYSNKLLNIHKILQNSRASYCVKPPVYDYGAQYRAKPEDIPKGIWSEESDSTYTSVEEVKGRWHYVERLFPKLRVPEPPNKISSTGWKATAEEPPNLPYYVNRSRNHMLPVYKDHVLKDRVLVTQVFKVHGDIWLFEYELKKYLEEKLGEKIESNVNEIACRVQVKGNHIDVIKEWLYNKGF